MKTEINCNALDINEGRPLSCLLYIISSYTVTIYFFDFSSKLFTADITFVYRKEKSLKCTCRDKFPNFPKCISERASGYTSIRICTYCACSLFLPLLWLNVFTKPVATMCACGLYGKIDSQDISAISPKRLRVSQSNIGCCCWVLTVMRTMTTATIYLQFVAEVCALFSGFYFRSDRLWCITFMPWLQ